MSDLQANEQQMQQHQASSISASDPNQLIRVPRREGCRYSDLIVQQLQSSLLDQLDSAVIGIVAAETGQGATTTAANIAIRLADQLAGPVLLIDCDQKRKGVSRHFRTRGLGLAECLENQLIDCCVSETRIHGLDVLGAGRKRVSLATTDISQSVGSLLLKARQQYAVTILDLPVFDDSDDARDWCSHIDGVLLVVKSGTRKSRLTQLNSEIESTGVRVLGSVMTRLKKELPAWLERFF